MIPLHPLSSASKIEKRDVQVRGGDPVGKANSDWSALPRLPDNVTSFRSKATLSIRALGEGGSFQTLSSDVQVSDSRERIWARSVSSVSRPSSFLFCLLSKEEEEGWARKFACKIGPASCIGGSSLW